MHSNYNNSVNNNLQGGVFDVTDNGLHYVFNGLKLIGDKCQSKTPQNKQLHLPQRSPPKSTRYPRNYAYAADVPTTAVRDSARYCKSFLLQQRLNQYQRQMDAKNRQALHQKNSPPEMVHRTSGINASQHLNNNNNDSHHHHVQERQQVETAQILDAISKHHRRSIAQSSNNAQTNRKKSSNNTTRTNVAPAAHYNHTSDKHYQHYYSYYYNRQLEADETERETIAPISPTEQYTTRRHIRKLPSHRMASKNHFNHANNLNHVDDDDSRKQHKNSSITVSQYPSYNTNNYVANENPDLHVLREKLPNNNVNPNLFTNTTNTLHSDDDDDDDNEWKHDSDDIDVVGDFLDRKNFEFYDANFKKLFNTKCKRRMCAGDDSAQTAAEAPRLYDAVESAKTNLGVFNPNDTEKVQIKKLPPSPRKTKAGKGAQKLLSPPAPRVLLYNKQSPRPSSRHLPRLSPSSLRVRDFRRMRAKSPPYNSDEVGEASARSDKRQQLAGKGPKSKNNEADKNDNTDNQKNYPDFDGLDAYDDDDVDEVSNFGDSVGSDISSDSENGYRSHAYKLTHSLNKYSSSNTEIASTLLSQSSDECLANPESLLMPSLFPHVPPYLSFSSNHTKGPEVPAELHRILKWRITNVMPKVVRCVLANSGMRLLKKSNDWMGIWGKHLKSPCFKTIRPYQKINHLPGSFKIGRKDSCWKNLQRQMIKHGRKDFGFMPRTFIIPNDLNILRKSWPKYSQRNVKWIIKPPASARGAGIRVVDRWAQIPKRRPLIVQKYIERPFLINGSKFDLRLYVLVTSINPLRVFLYHNGLARFASVKYSDKSDTLNDRCMHLTNYSINKFSSNYSKNEDVNACHGHKWTIKSLWTYLANRGIRTDLLWETLRSLVLRTILAGENSINNMIKMNVESKYSVFELFGFDVLLDADLIPWLLEVNISPSLHSELPLDAHVKAPLVQSVLNTAMYNVPPKLSLEKQREIAVKMSLPPGAICFDKRLYINYLSRVEKVKHNTFTRKPMEDRNEYINAILENLTPDDVRCLIVAEDELARSSPLERIFPTNQTYKYLKYTDNPRYYNRLLDAWENRYGNNRNEGIALLREFCDRKYHLEVPPVPAKKHPTFRPRALMLTRTPTTTATLAMTNAMKSIRRKCRMHYLNRMLNFHRLHNNISVEDESWLDDDDDDEKNNSS